MQGTQYSLLKAYSACTTLCLLVHSMFRKKHQMQAQPNSPYPELEKMIDEKNTSSGSEEPMTVSFRDVDPFSLWVGLADRKRTIIHACERLKSCP